MHFQYKIFVLDKSIEELKNIINSTEKIKEFKVTRFYDDHYEYYAIDESGEEKRVEFAPIDNLEIIELRCGNFEVFDKNRLIETDRLWFILENDSRLKMDELVQESAPLKSMLVEDYFCEDTS